MRLTLKISFVVYLLALTAIPTLNAQSIQHKVQDEQTLFSIAQKYGVTVQQLKKWNNLSNNTISIGQTLIIKQIKKEDAYVVKSDDTLFSIAQQFGVTVDQLKKWNNIAGTNISAGAILVVHPEGGYRSVNQPETEGQPEEQIEPAATPSPVPAITQISEGYYTVKSGDTLFRIAQLFGMDVDQLKALNSLTSNNIRVGQELKVAAGASEPVVAKQDAVIRYELKQGMGLNEFLGVFKMSREQFTRLNPEMKATYLNKGQVVRIEVPKVDTETISTASGSKLTRLGKARVKKYAISKKGTVTTNGELYNPKALTAAHASMAIGSVIFVKNPANNRGVIVRINDRITQKGLKLSKAARQALGITGDDATVVLYRINE